MPARGAPHSVPKAASSEPGPESGAEVITDGLLDLLEGLMQWVAGMLPTDTVVGEQNLGFQVFSGANYFFPVVELGTVLLAIMALGVPLAGVSLVIWLLVGVLRGGSAKA